MVVKTQKMLKEITPIKRPIPARVKARGKRGCGTTITVALKEKTRTNLKTFPMLAKHLRKIEERVKVARKGQAAA